jgi:hypothetical protein
VVPQERRKNRLVLEWGDDVTQEIGGDEDIGVADDDDFVLGVAMELDEGGNLGVDAEGFAAEDEAGVALRVFREQLVDEGADGVVGRGDAEEDLDGRGIILGEPALEAAAGVVIETLEGFQERDGRGEGKVRNAAVQREAERHNPLPEVEEQAKCRQCGQDDEHGRRLREVRAGDNF